MVSETAIYALGGLAAAEVTGVTNYTGIGGSGDNDGSEPTQVGGGVIGGLPPGLGMGGGSGIRNAIRDLQATTAAAQSAGTTVVETAGGVQERVEKVREVVRVPSRGGGSGGGGGGSGGWFQNPAWPYSPQSPGGTQYTMTESSNPTVRDIGATGSAIGSGINATFNAGGRIEQSFSDQFRDVEEGIGEVETSLRGPWLPGTRESGPIEITENENGYDQLMVPTSVDGLNPFSGSGSSDGSNSSDGSGSGSGSGAGVLSGIKAFDGPFSGLNKYVSGSDGSQSDRNTDGSDSQPDTNGSDNPDRGERERTETVPTQSADQSPSDGRLISRGYSMNTGSEEKETEPEQPSFGYGAGRL